MSGDETSKRRSAHAQFGIVATINLNLPDSALVPAESSAGCYIRVSDVESIHRAFASSRLPRAGIPRMDALEDKPWGLREFAVVDTDGNLLRIGQVIPR